MILWYKLSEGAESRAKEVQAHRRPITQQEQVQKAGTVHLCVVVSHVKESCSISNPVSVEAVSLFIHLFITYLSTQND